MSTRADSTKKPNVFNEANEALYDPYQSFPTDEIYSNVPWPEWNDADLNSESWVESSKGKPASGKGTALEVSSLPSTFFEDSNPPKLPAVIREYVSSWRRPHEVFPKSNLTVYDNSNPKFELSVPSPVADCNFFQSFNEILPILQFYAIKDGFAVESESAAFLPTTHGEPWRPWHHVYSLCKAGKGQIHKPLYSPFGKYVLRIFYFGCWRKFTIDDRIPCDKYGLCMLPVTQVAGELWPVLLAKGLLKIISLTSSEIDFPLVSFLTGWIDLSLTVGNKSHEQIWRRMQILTSHYELPSAEAPPASVKESKKGSSKKETQKEGARENEDPSGNFCVLLASLGGFNLDETELNYLKVVITMNRDTPLTKADKREATKPWKRLRWVYWASEKGIWTDELLLPPYRRLQYMTNAKNLSSHLAPDPKQEATLYALPEEDIVPADPEEDDSPSEMTHWSDFYKFCEYLIDLDAFLKPSRCDYNFRMTCLNGGSSKKDLTASAMAKTAKTAKTAKPAEPQNFYYHSPVLTPTLNQPALLYCESTAGIFICFSLWVCPESKKSLTGYLDPQQPQILKVGHATLIVERFDWRTLRQGEILGFAKSNGNSSFYLNLKPGRHVLRIWLNSDSPYAVSMYSNVDLCVHKGSKIRFLMNNESERILRYIANVSNSFMALTQKFGKSDLPSALRDFYEAIKPGNDAALLYRTKLDLFIEIFLNSIMSALKNSITSEEDLKIMLAALRSLFLNPNIECDLPGGQPSSIYGAGPKKALGKKVVPDLKERTLSEILRHPWTAEEIRQIVTIQRIFRGYRVRLLLKYQNPTRRECKPYAERLKKICDTLFAPAKRDVEVGKIIRMVVTTVPDLLTTFKFHDDFFKTIELEEFTGKAIGVEANAWIPLARFVVACHCPEFVPCAFYLSCNLEQFVVVGVNNDTNEEIFSLTNSVSPYFYRSNSKGYTIFIFGWNESNPKTVNWRLEMVRMKYCQTIHLCNKMSSLECNPYGMPAIEMNEIKNFYVPNHKSRLCRCSIKIQKRSLLSLRLSTSFSEVQFVLIISLDSKRCGSDSEESLEAESSVLVKCFSKNGAVLLPSLVLENVRTGDWWNETEEESTVYFLEAQVLDNSWPLTKREWGIVEPIRVNGESWNKTGGSLQSLKKTASESRKKSTRTSKRSLQERNVENPFWTLQVLGDSGEGDPAEAMTVEEDRSYYESIKAMKISWEEKNPGRRRKGRDLRHDFLHSTYLESRTKEQEENFGEAENAGEKFEISAENDDFKSLLQKMTSFSYLTEDKSPERYSKSPRVLPWMPTEELIRRHKKEWQDSSSNSAMDSSGFESDEKRNVAEEEEEERREFLSLCNHYRVIMVNHLAEEQQLSNQLMDQASGQRLKAILRMTG